MTFDEKASPEGRPDITARPSGEAFLRPYSFYSTVTDFARFLG